MSSEIRAIAASVLSKAADIQLEVNKIADIQLEVNKILTMEC